MSTTQKTRLANYSSFHSWSGLEKSFTFSFGHFGAVNSYFPLYLAIFGMVTPNRQNNQVILVQACSWPVRRQSFAIQTIYNKLFLSFDKKYCKLKVTIEELLSSSIYSWLAVATPSAVTNLLLTPYSMSTSASKARVTLVKNMRWKANHDVVASPYHKGVELGTMKMPSL